MRYSKADIPREVSSRGRPVVAQVAVDFPWDVCLTISRNHKVFLLYHIILYITLYHLAYYITLHHITLSVIVCITIEAYFMYLHSSHAITRCFRTLSIAWEQARCHELSPFYSNGPQIGTLADALKTQLNIQSKMNVRYMGEGGCVNVSEYIKKRLSQNQLLKHIYQE